MTEVKDDMQAEFDEAIAGIKKPPEKKSLAETLYIQAALEQVSNYKKEALVALIALLIYSAAILLATFKTERLLESGHFLDLSTPAHHPTIFVILAVLLILLSCAVIIWALFSIANPLKKSTTTLRLALLAFGALLVVAAKSLILGSFARILFAGDPARFEFAKTGVDHLSSLLGVLLAAAFYVLLARCLKEEKLALFDFGKSYLVLLVWVAVVYLLKYLALLILPSHVVISSIVALLSALATLWYVALALALQKESAEKHEAKELLAQREDAHLESTQSEYGKSDSSKVSAEPQSEYKKDII